MTEFLHQGGFAFYVWSAYGISVLTLGLLVIWTVASYRKAKDKVARLGGDTQL